MTKILLIGASGFIGGDFLAALTKAHPEYAITAFVRSNSTATKIKQAFSAVSIVHGDLDDVENLRGEVSKADITLNLGAAKHIRGLKAIQEAAAERRKAFYIQIGGASLVSQAEIFSKTFGESSDCTFDDVDGAQALRDIIRKYPNREVENHLLDVSEQRGNVRNALVVAPLIYGQGRGPINQRSVQVPELCRVALERKRAAQIGKGQNIWSNIHVEDLSSLLVQLVERAAAGDDDERLWGQNGLYFAESSPGIKFESLVQRIADSAHDLALLSSTHVDQLSATDMDELIPHGSGILGTNARLSGNRARQLLSWNPKQTFNLEIPRAVASEAASLGKAK